MTAYVLNPAALSRSVGEATVLYLYSTDASAVIDSVGYAIWTTIGASPEPIGPDDIAATLAPIFATNAATIRGHIAAFIDDLAEQGFLSRTPSSES